MIDPEVAREQLRETVAELFHAGLMTPTGGNASVRAGPDEFWVTPATRFKGRLATTDMVRVDLAGQALEGEGPPSKETPLHSCLYRARPDIGAIVHAHAPYTTLFGLYSLPVQPVTADAVSFRDLPTVEFVLPGTRELGRRVAEVLGEASAILLRNHGAVTVGVDLRQAADRCHALEETCRLLLLAKLLGEPPASIPETLAAALFMIHDRKAASDRRIGRTAGET
jgi:L-fuculose-phosphate aldolase